MIRILLCCWCLLTSAYGMAPHYAESEQFSSVITVRNPYDRAVRVKDIDTSCACDELTLASYFLLPGETTSLTVKVDNINKSGLNSHRLWLYLTDPDYPPITATIEWVIRPHVAVDLIPPNAPLDQRPAPALRDIYQTVSSIRPDESKRLRKILRFFTEDDMEDSLTLNIHPPENSFWDFEVRQQSKQSALLIARGKVKDEPLPTGSYTEHIKVTTNNPKKPEITLQFHVAVDVNSGSLDANNPFNQLR